MHLYRKCIPEYDQNRRGRNTVVKKRNIKFYDKCRVMFVAEMAVSTLTSWSANSQYCMLYSVRVRTQAYVLLKASSHTQFGKHCCGM